MYSTVHGKIFIARALPSKGALTNLCAGFVQIQCSGSAFFTGQHLGNNYFSAYFKIHLNGISLIYVINLKIFGLKVSPSYEVTVR